MLAYRIQRWRLSWLAGGHSALLRAASAKYPSSAASARRAKRHREIINNGSS